MSTTPATTAELTNRLKQEAQALGFGLVGVAPAVTPPGAARLDEWLDAGYAGQMEWIRDRRDAYEHPRHVLDGVRSVVMLTLGYRTSEPVAPATDQGRISRYAWGTADYHDIVRERLHKLADWFREQAPAARTRGVVDTAPLMERDFAQLAGLGWIGKNTLLLNRSHGSWFFLAALLTDAELQLDAPHASNHCGACTACLDECPTDAFAAPYVLDASKCISYLTIEHRDPIPDALREGVGEWLLGCDVCQDVCPWNRRALGADAPEFKPTHASDPVDLPSLLYLDEEEFRRRYRKTPLWRPHRRGLLRNAATSLGSRGASARGRAALRHGLGDVEPLVRGACAWALGRVGTPDDMSALLTSRSREQDADVLDEIEAALALLSNRLG